MTPPSTDLATSHSLGAMEASIELLALDQAATKKSR